MDFFLCSPAGCTCSKVTSTSIFPGVNSSSTAPLRLSPVRHLSSPCALASTPTSRGGTLSAAGTSWRLWKKITSKRHSWELYKWGVFLSPPTCETLDVSTGCWNTSKLWGTTSCWKPETPCMTFTRRSLTRCRRRRAGSSCLFSTFSFRRQSDSATPRTAAGTTCVY